MCVSLQCNAAQFRKKMKIIIEPSRKLWFLSDHALWGWHTDKNKITVWLFGRVGALMANSSALFGLC